ncbi:hypothetical protein PGT21_015755 [Puccinia graminis f. sp. tritici]|uniref:Uncharacterized protein n=1 Tax=Puccinia graminis f. sp. tritici TaxID=56615 RepID=A0A5B0Q5G1_PUCGR|nr:hypothetical protein PGT21_015755 [Puccinia graminis f. sp. tritici]
MARVVDFGIDKQRERARRDSNRTQPTYQLEERRKLLNGQHILCLTHTEAQFSSASSTASFPRTQHFPTLKPPCNRT